MFEFSELAIVNLIVQLLGTFLCEDPITYYRQLPASARKLHDYALNRLNVVGPSHPEEFKKVLLSFPALKSKYVFSEFLLCFQVRLLYCYLSFLVLFV